MIIDEVGTIRNKWGQRITDVNYMLTFLLRSGTSKSTWFKHCRVCTFQVLFPQQFRGPYFFGSWTDRVVQKATVTAHLCPSTMTRRVYISRFFLLRMARTHANALATEIAQNRMAQRHHLSKALVVSLIKTKCSNRGFCRGKGRRSGGLLKVLRVYREFYI